MVQYVRDRPFPRFIDPMKCLPVHKLPEGKDWVYEVKWDGYRTLAIKDGKVSSLYSDRGNAHTEKFPGIVLALSELPVGRIVLDGEVVALNEEGVPNFQELQNWRTTRLAIAYYIFDVLHLDGKDLLKEPLSIRRDILNRLANRFRDPLLMSETFSVDANTFVASIKSRGLEGVVAKSLKSAYESGRRTGSWQKQRFGEVQDFVIGGFIPGNNGVESILAGEWRGDKLYFLDKVRAGLVRATRQMLYDALNPYITKKCPFVNLPEPRTRAHAVDEEAMRECVWVKPVQKVELEFVNRTREGRLRHPKFRRLP